MLLPWGNEVLKAKNIAKLTTAFAAGQLVPGNLTPFEVLLNGQSPREAQSQLGIPIDLAFIIDGLYLGLPSDKAGQWAIDVCSVISCDADLSKIGASTMLITVELAEHILARMTERGGGPIDTAQCVNALECAKGIIRKSLQTPITLHDQDLKELRALPSKVLPVEIAQSAANSVVARREDTTEGQKADWQQAGMFCLDAIRRTAELFGNEYEALSDMAFQQDESEMLVSARRRAANLKGKQLVFKATAQGVQSCVAQLPQEIRGRIRAAAVLNKLRNGKRKAAATTDATGGGDARGQSISAEV